MYSVESLLELAEHTTGIAPIDGYARSMAEYLAATTPENLVPILKQAIRNEKLLKEAVEMAEYIIKFNESWKIEVMHDALENIQEATCDFLKRVK